MKIDNSPKTLGALQNTAGQRAAGAASSAKAASAAAPAAEATAKAASSTIMNTVMSNVGNTEAPFNAQKVAEIRQAIAEGRFQINPERIADGLIDNVREMLARDRNAA